MLQSSHEKFENFGQDANLRKFGRKGRLAQALRQFKLIISPNMIIDTL